MAATTKEHIIALSQLMNYAAGKRFGLVNNVLTENRLAIELNEKIKEEIGIDVFAEIAIDKIFQFEEELYNKITNYAKENIHITPIDNDLLELRKDVKSMAIEYFNGLKIVNNVDVSFKNRLKRIGLSVPDLNSYLKSMDYVSVYAYIDEMGENRFYLASTKTRIRNQNKILFILLDSSSDLISSYYNKYGKGHTAYRPNPDYVVPLSVFLIDYEKFNNLLNSPMKIFNMLIEKYGLEMKMNGKVKKFFFYEFIISRDPFKYDFFEFIEDKRIDEVNTHLWARPTPIGSIIKLFYGINFDKYFEDLSNFRI